MLKIEIASYNFIMKINMVKWHLNLSVQCFWFLQSYESFSVMYVGRMYKKCIFVLILQNGGMVHCTADCSLHAPLTLCQSTFGKYHTVSHQCYMLHNNELFFRFRFYICFYSKTNIKVEETVLDWNVFHKCDTF